MGEPYWYMAYSHVLQRVGEATTGRRWAWPAREGLEIKVSPLVLTLTSLRSCWEPTPCIIYRKVEEGLINQVISFLDELAIHVLSHEAWDQFAWPPVVAMP